MIIVRSVLREGIIRGKVPCLISLWYGCILAMWLVSVTVGLGHCTQIVDIILPAIVPSLVPTLCSLDDTYCTAHAAGVRLRHTLQGDYPLMVNSLKDIFLFFSHLFIAAWVREHPWYHFISFTAQWSPWWQLKLFPWFLCPRQGKKTLPQGLWQRPSVSDYDFHILVMWISSTFFFFLRLPFSPLTPGKQLTIVMVTMFFSGHWCCCLNLHPFSHLGEEKWWATCFKTAPWLHVLPPKGRFYMISSAAPWWSEHMASMAFATVVI